MKYLFNKKNKDYVLSGSCAIIVALKSNLEEGARVLLPDNVCARVLESVLLCNMIPIIVSPKNGLVIENSDVDAAKKITNIDAIIIVHNYGLESNTKLIKENNPNTMIIEDCAQYWGHNKKIGLYSDYVITSIDTNKPLKGNHIGIILYDNKDIFLDRGVKTRYKKELHLPFSVTQSLPDKKLNQIIEKANKNNKKYNKYIVKLNNILKKYDNIIFPNKECNNLKYPIIFNNKKDYNKFTKIADSYSFVYSEPHTKGLNELPILNKYEYCYINNKDKHLNNQIFIKTENLTNEYIKLLDNILKEVFL